MSLSESKQNWTNLIWIWASLSETAWSWTNLCEIARICVSQSKSDWDWVDLGETEWIWVGMSGFEQIWTNLDESEWIWLGLGDSLCVRCKTPNKTSEAPPFPPISYPALAGLIGYHWHAPCVHSMLWSSLGMLWFVLLSFVGDTGCLTQVSPSQLPLELDE